MMIVISIITFMIYFLSQTGRLEPVSYTHLDVYKRQILLDKKGRIVDLKLPKPSDSKFEKMLEDLKGM